MNQVKEFFEYIFNSFKFLVIVQPWEKGIRVRSGKTIKKLDSGIFFKIPYIDSVYVQETRMRMTQMCMQTLTTKDGHTLTINSSLGWCFLDVYKVYDTICHIEGTISNLSMSITAEYVFNHQLKEIKPKEIEDAVLNELKKHDYGLGFDYFKLTNFASVKTFRLIQDSQSWTENGVKLTEKK